MSGLRGPLRPCATAPAELKESVLFERAATDPLPLVLSAGERRGVCEVYPSATARMACPAPPDGGGCDCALGGGRRATGVVPVLLLALTLVLRRRT